MSWYALEIKVAPVDEDFAAEFLHSAGANGVWVENETKTDVLVKGYYVHKEKLLEQAREYLGDKILSIQWQLVDPKWQDEWKKGFKQVVIQDKFSVQPAWDKKTYDYLVNVTLDPGMAFGTGTHETTQLAIHFIDKYLQKTSKVVDIGCGSGILSIISAKLNASEVTAIDIDQNAIEATQHNLTLNNLSSVKVIHGDLVKELSEQKNFVVANMLFTILIKLSEDILEVLAPGGVLIASGILTSEQSKVLEVFQKKGLEVIETKTMGEWFAFVARRRNDA